MEIKGRWKGGVLEESSQEQSREGKLNRVNRKLRLYVFQNILVGLVFLVPLVATLMVLYAVFNFSDTFLFQFLPEAWRPAALFGLEVPGLGLVLTLVFVFLSGLVIRNYIGKKLISRIETAIYRIPIFRGVYSAFRQFLESLLMNRSEAFTKVVAIEYPRKGLYTLAFVTGQTSTLLKSQFGDESVLTVFVPTTPNPTSGFLLFVPKGEAIEVPIKIDEAFRLVVSGGVLTSTAKRDITNLF